MFVCAIDNKHCADNYIYIFTSIHVHIWNCYLFCTMEGSGGGSGGSGAIELTRRKTEGKKGASWTDEDIDSCILFYDRKMMKGEGLVGVGWVLRGRLIG